MNPKEQSDEKKLSGDGVTKWQHRPASTGWDSWGVRILGQNKGGDGQKGKS